MKKTRCLLLILLCFASESHSLSRNTLPPKNYRARWGHQCLYAYSQFPDQYQFTICDWNFNIKRFRFGAGFYGYYSNERADINFSQWFPVHLGYSLYENNYLSFDMNYKSNYLTFAYREFDSQRAFDESTISCTYNIMHSGVESQQYNTSIKFSYGYRNFWNNEYSGERGWTAGVTLSFGWFFSHGPKYLDAKLMSAVSEGNANRAFELIEMGSNTNAINRMNETPLRLAIINKHPEVVDLLIANGADVNCADKYGNTPLHLSVKTGNPSIVKKLIDAGSIIDRKGEFGNTPLHLSRYSGKENIANVLLENDADTTCLNTYGLNPKEIEVLPEYELLVLQAAELLNSNGRWKDSKTAKIHYNKLRTAKKKYVVNSLALQVINERRLRFSILILAIKLGIRDSEEKLADLLYIYGDKSMAEDYLNCGNSVLASAGRQWAKRNGYSIWQSAGSNRAGWGRF